MDSSKIKYVYVITSKGERKFWTKIGVAFQNRDGSLNCKLDSLPVGGELQIRDYVPREERERAPASRMDGPHALVS